MTRTMQFKHCIHSCWCIAVLIFQLLETLGQQTLSYTKTTTTHTPDPLHVTTYFVLASPSDALLLSRDQPGSLLNEVLLSRNELCSKGQAAKGETCWCGLDTLKPTHFLANAVKHLHYISSRKPYMLLQNPLHNPRPNHIPWLAASPRCWTSSRRGRAP